MINLLPPQEKAQLLAEKNKQLAIVLGNMVLVSLICLSLVLLALKFYLLQDVIYEKVILENVQKQYQTSDFLSLKNTIQGYNKKLTAANDFYSRQVYFSKILKDVLEITNNGELSLTNITMSGLKEGKEIKVKLSGKSDTRDELLSFKKNLENSNKIKNVYFPPNSWVKSKNVDFTVSFEFLVN